MTTLNQSLSPKFQNGLTLRSTEPRGLKTMTKLPFLWLRRAKERQQLRREIGTDADRNRRLELDIGLPPGTLQREMNKPFWIA